MKKSVLTLVLVLSSLTGISQNVAKTDSLLCDIYAKDQNVRKELGRISALGNIDSLQLAVKNMHHTDSLNQDIVFKLLTEHGWVSGLSGDANSAIFLVIDHADLKSQQAYFPLVKQNAANGTISEGDCATLQDRILMKEGKKQLYGTQTVSITENGITKTYLWPLANPCDIDTIRQSVGLPPLSQYISVMAQVGMTLIVDHHFTVEEFSKRFAFD